MKEALYAATGALDFIVTTVTEFHFEHAELFVDYPVRFTFSCTPNKQITRQLLDPSNCSIPPGNVSFSLAEN